MLELVLRIGLSLLVVLGLMWGLAKVLRRPLAGRGGGKLAVLARQQLTKGSTVAVVRVLDKALILGVTEGQVTLLGETDLVAMQAPATSPVRRKAVPLTPNPTTTPVRDGRLAGSVLSPQTWALTLGFLRERTVRR